MLIYCPVTPMSLFNVTVSPCLEYLEYLNILCKLFCPFYRSFMNLLKSTNLCGIQPATPLHCENGTFILTLICLSFYWLFIHVKTSLLSQSNLAALLRDIAESPWNSMGAIINNICLQHTIVTEFKGLKLGGRTFLFKSWAISNVPYTPTCTLI